MIIDPVDPALLERLDRALARMSWTRRNVYLYTRVEGHTFAEAAAVYGISEQQVRRHVAKAMWLLRRHANPGEFSFWQRWRPF